MTEQDIIDCLGRVYALIECGWCQGRDDLTADRQPTDLYAYGRDEFYYPLTGAIKRACMDFAMSKGEGERPRVRLACCPETRPDPFQWFGRMWRRLTGLFDYVLYRRVTGADFGWFNHQSWNDQPGRTQAEVLALIEEVVEELTGPHRKVPFLGLGALARDAEGSDEPA